MSVPTKIFVTKGVGRHASSLPRFRARAGGTPGIQKFNLVQVSSIFPAEVQDREEEEGLKPSHPARSSMWS